MFFRNLAYSNTLKIMLDHSYSIIEFNEIFTRFAKIMALYFDTTSQSIRGGSLSLISFFHKYIRAINRSAVCLKISAQKVTKLFYKGFFCNSTIFCLLGNFLCFLSSADFFPKIFFFSNTNKVLCWAPNMGPSYLQKLSADKI